MTLIRLLPFMIGSYVEKNDNHWECFLQLWDICSMVCVFEVTTSDATYLTWLVEAYLEEFFVLYDVPMTPKLHYLVHLPRQILEEEYGTGNIVLLHVRMSLIDLAL